MFWTWLAFSRQIIFRFSKRCSEAREQYFWDFLGSHRGKISRWKNLFVFQRLMFLYQLVNLVLETCFIFSKTLKFKQDILSWVSRLVRSFEQRALWFPYSRLFFGIVFKKGLFLEYLEYVTKSIVVSMLDSFDISFSERCFVRWLVTEIITFESRATCRECLLFKRLSWHGKSVRCYQTFYFSGRGLQLFLFLVFEEKSPYRVGCHVDDFKVESWLRVKFPVSWTPCWLIKIKHMDRLKTGRFLKTH